MAVFSTVEWCVGFATSVVLSLIGCLNVLSLLQYVQFKDEFWFKPRWRSHAQMYRVCVALFIMGSPRGVFTTWIFMWMKGMDIGVAHTLPRKITLFLYFFAFSFLPLVTLVFGIMIRLWFTYFEAELALSLDSMKWKSLLDHSLLDNDNWFVAKRDTLGSPHYLVKRTLPLIAVVYVLLCYSVAQNRTLTAVLSVLLIIVCVSCAVIFFVKYPPFNDTLHLRTEAKRTCKVLAAFLAVALLVVWAYQVKARNAVHVAVMISCTQIAFGVLFLAMQMTMINYVIADFHNASVSVCCRIPLIFPPRQQQQQRDDSFILPQQRSLSRASKSMTKSIAKTAKFQDLLVDPDSFVQFISFVFNELSYENLIALIECVKFRHAVAHLTGNDISDGQKFSQRNLFCPEVTGCQSSLVDSISTVEDVSEVYVELCAKYVSLSATMSVNLPGYKRNRLLTLMGQAETGQDGVSIPFDVFDPLLSECFLLLNDSFFRFRRRVSDVSI